MERRILRAFAGIALACLVGISMAQTGRLGGRMYAGVGSGRVDSWRGSDRIDRAAITLRNDGTFNLRLEGNNTHNLTGTWRVLGNNDVQLRVRTGFGDGNLDGTGRADVDVNGILRGVSIQGGGQDRFSLSFSGRDSDWYQRGNRRQDDRRRDDWRRDEDWTRTRNSLRVSHSGRGEIRYGNGDRDRINAVEVHLERDGDAGISLRGEDPITFLGRWRRDGSNRVLIDIDRATRHSDAQGSGHVILDGREGFREVNLSGRLSRNGTRFNMNFVASGRFAGDDRFDDFSSDERRAIGTYQFVDRFREGNDRDSIRYTLRLHSDGRAELVAQANEDLPRGRDSINDHGEVLHRLDRHNEVRHSGRWDANGSQITIRLASLRYGGRSEGEESVFRGRLLNDGRDLRIDEWDRNFYGRDTRFWFDRI